MLRNTLLTNDTNLHSLNSSCAGDLVCKMEQLHEKMMRGFWIGNQMVWCYRGCNPAPEQILIPMVRQLIEDLGQSVFLFASIAPPDDCNLMVMLDQILMECYAMEKQRLIACSFLSRFGVWFWRFVQDC